MKNRRVKIAALAFAIMSGLCTAPVSATVLMEPFTEEADIATSLDTGEYRSFQQAAAELKLKMLGRQQDISIKIRLENEDMKEVLSRLLETVYAEDSLNPAAGDYLRQSVIQMRVSCQALEMPGDPASYCTFTFSCIYTDTLQQENYVTVQVKKIIADMKLAGCSDDEKIKAVYDYITRTVDYDYKGINDNSSHSAYAALYGKKAVCQGYSTLMYRLLRECGISNRIITGKSQNQAYAWNIVPINGRWYNLDATWDSNFDGNDQKYMYFLKGSSDFADHTRDPEFLTAEFLAKYPVSTSSYARYQPAVTKVTGVKAAEVTDRSVTLTWNPQEKAECYYVCHLVNGKYQTSSKWKTTDNRFKITIDFNGEKLKSGESYTYGVIAYSAKTGNTVVSTPVTVTVSNTVKPSKTSITGLSSSKGKLTVSWKKVSSCDGYQLQYSTDKKFSSKNTRTMKISGGNKLKTTVKSLKKGKKYYIRVRAWKKTEGKTLYASWSTVKGMKCK